MFNPFLMTFLSSMDTRYYGEAEVASVFTNKMLRLPPFFTEFFMCLTFLILTKTLGEGSKGLSCRHRGAKTVELSKPSVKKQRETPFKMILFNTTLQWGVKTNTQWFIFGGIFRKIFCFKVVHLTGRKAHQGYT